MQKKINFEVECNWFEFSVFPSPRLVAVPKLKRHYTPYKYLYKYCLYKYWYQKTFISPLFVYTYLCTFILGTHKIIHTHIYISHGLASWNKDEESNSWWQQAHSWLIMHTSRTWYKVNFKQSLTGLNSEFSFLTSGNTLVKELSLSYYLSGARERTVEFIPLLKVLALCKMQITSFRIWTHVIMSISYNGYHYTTNAYTHTQSVCIYPISQLQLGCDTMSIFLGRVLLVWNQSFPKEPGLSYNLLIAEERTDEFMPYPRAITQSELQTALSRVIYLFSL